jgi:hypothetical protein
VEKLGEAVDQSPESVERLRETLPDEIRTALGYHLTHPCFPELRMMLPFGPRYPSDVGRFPEYFLIRHLVPYLRAFEKDSEINGRFSTQIGILRSADELCAMLPVEIQPLINTNEPEVDPVLEIERLVGILQSCRRNLMAHLRRGNQVYERLKTTIAWYFRETLRFGSHSRISMRYERVLLEWVAEALAVASLLDQRLAAGRGKEITSLIHTLEKAVETHEHYSRRFTEGDHTKGLLEEYDRKLFAIADQMED